MLRELGAKYAGAMPGDGEEAIEQAPLPLEARPPSRAARLRNQMASFWDTDLAIIGAVIAGALGLLGVTDLKTTVALTLAVLAAVAGSLHRDRGMRERLEGSVKELDSRLASVSRAYSNPLPFDVIRARYVWEFDERGEVATVRKRARIRFVHNGVWTLLAWHTVAERIKNPTARLYLKDEAIHELKIFKGLDLGDGKRGNVIGLDRQYRQNQVMDYEYSFDSHGNFPARQEWIDLAIETFIADLTIEIVWPSKRVPMLVWLDVDAEPEISVEKEGGVARTTIKRQNLMAGQSIPIRWLWASAQSLRQSQRQEADDG